MGRRMDGKVQRLLEGLKSHDGALVAYSGGADSAFLAEMAHRALGERSLAVTADSPSIPRRELALAKQLAEERGWRHLVVETLELNDERYASNPTDRCYWCKTALFERLEPLSLRYGFPILLGTNLDDLGDHRPGLRAASEAGVHHPLVDAGFRKSDVRSASAEIGLPTHDKPAAACLASRFAYGVRVTASGLARVERAEEWMSARGYPVVRVRDLGRGRARVEVDPSDVERVLSDSSHVIAELKRLGFTEVLIDERGYRSGALNEGVVFVGASPLGPKSA